MNVLSTNLKIHLAFAAILIISTYSFAEPSEVATGTLSCNAQWNEFCEDQKKISVPDEHKLCKHTITVTEKSGNSAYEQVSADTKGVVVKFHAKGNGDRFKQQSGSITLKVVLMGVRENSACTPNEKAFTVTTAPITTITPPPSVPPAVPAQPAQEEVLLPQKSTPPAETAAIAATAPVAQTQKLHACACSKWIDADRVTNCLVNGRARDNASCDSFMASIQCVSSRDECREIQKEACHEMFGLNQSTSQKRIFVADSPYCQKK